MMYLYRVIKSDSVVFSDVVYKVGADKSTTKILSETAESDIREDEEKENTALTNEESVNEDEIWQRLQERLAKERQAILSNAYREAADIKNSAQQEGLKEAVAKRISEIDALIHRVDGTLRKVESKIESKLNEYEKSLTMLTADIASKVLNQKIEEDDLVLVGLVRSAIEEFKNSEWITVTLSNEMKESITEVERILKQDVEGGRLVVTTKEAPKGTCIVETPEGVVDASIQVQIENLKDMLKQIQTANG
ncbi:MAG: hypothetical protein GX257_00995 [Clostridiales bacterium]|nr:hypothetical protein [Clostridiales bacterium]